MPSKFESCYNDNIEFSYEIFDRIILNGYIQKLQRENQMVYFLRSVRGIKCISTEALKNLTKGFVGRVEKYAEEKGIPVLTAKRGESKLALAQGLDNGQEGAVCIIKSKEYGRSFSSYEPKRSKDKDYRRICRAVREVNHYYLYIRDPEVGGLNYIKICSYFPFNVEVYVNGHNWLEVQLKKRGIGYLKEDNCILGVDDVGVLRELCSRMNDDPLWDFADRWVYQFVPLSTKEREAGYYYRYFLSQVEHSNNLVFKDSDFLGELFQSMIDHYRRIGRPESISQIFEKRITSNHRGVFQTNIHMDGEHPCIKSWYKKCYVKQYNKKGKVLRTELCVNNPYDLGIKRSILNLGYLGEVGHRITGRYLDSQLGIDVRFLARHNLAELGKTEQRGDKRITGIRIDDQRIMGVIEALVHSSNLVSHFTNKSLRKEVHRIRSIGDDGYGSTKMGYDLKRLVVKGIVKKVEGKHRYIFTKTGHKVCVMLLLLKNRVIEPLLSGILSGVKTGSNQIKSKIIECYEKLDLVLDDIFDFAGLKKSQILVQNTRSP